MKYLKYILLATLLYFPIFGFLDTLDIRIWDTSRLAVNAIEMSQNGNFLVTKYAGNPDMWNTKTPLMIWLQVLFLKLLGPGDLAIRIPSALAALGTCAALLVFLRRFLNDAWLGIIAVLVLITSEGYVSLHCKRTGDYDALLTLFTTLMGLSFFAFTEQQKSKYLYWFFLFLIGAVLTKSITGLIFAPALFLYLIYRKQVRTLLTDKHFYLGLGMLLLVTCSYYLLREQYNPGYIAAVFENELAGRYLKVLENHNDGGFFYLHNLATWRYAPYILLVICGMATGLCHRDARVVRLTVFSGLMAGLFLLIISFGKTKLEWYDIPVYPYFACLVSLFIYTVFVYIKNQVNTNQYIRLRTLPYLFLALFFTIPYSNTMSRVFTPVETQIHEGSYEMGIYLKQVLKGRATIDAHYLIYSDYNAQIRYYLHLFKVKGMPLADKAPSDLKPMDTVLVMEDPIKRELEKMFVTEVIRTDGRLTTYKILGLKN